MSAQPPLHVPSKLAGDEALAHDLPRAKQNPQPKGSPRAPDNTVTQTTRGLSLVPMDFKSARHTSGPVARFRSTGFLPLSSIPTVVPADFVRTLSLRLFRGVPKDSRKACDTRPSVIPKWVVSWPTLPSSFFSGFAWYHGWPPQGGVARSTRLSGSGSSTWRATCASESGSSGGWPRDRFGGSQVLSGSLGTF